LQRNESATQCLCCLRKKCGRTNDNTCAQANLRAGVVSEQEKRLGLAW
jgi:hypothetical protein